MFIFPTWFRPNLILFVLPSSSSLAQQPLPVKACQYPLVKWAWLSVTYCYHKQDSQSDVWEHGLFGAWTHDGRVVKSFELTTVPTDRLCFQFKQMESTNLTLGSFDIFVALTFDLMLKWFIFINLNNHQFKEPVRSIGSSVSEPRSFY